MRYLPEKAKTQMSLSIEQINGLLGMISSVESDEIDCGGCFGQIAEFAEFHLSHKEIPEAMKSIEMHLQQCLCCKDEFNALLKGLQAIESV